jgi:hypothetical protein
MTWDVRTYLCFGELLHTLPKTDCFAIDEMAGGKRWLGVDHIEPTAWCENVELSLQSKPTGLNHHKTQRVVVVLHSAVHVSKGLREMAQKGPGGTTGRKKPVIARKKYRFKPGSM